MLILAWLGANNFNQKTGQSVASNFSVSCTTGAKPLLIPRRNLNKFSLLKLSIPTCLYGKTVPHHNFWLQNVEKLRCDNIVNVHRSLRILYYCTTTAESCVLLLQNHGSSLPLSLSYTLRKYYKAFEFLLFSGEIERKNWPEMAFVSESFIPPGIFNKTIPWGLTDQTFFRFPINSGDSLLTHLRKASLSNFASNLKWTWINIK